jgi:hypothetical protein
LWVVCQACFFFTPSADWLVKRTSLLHNRGHKWGTHSRPLH